MKLKIKTITICSSVSFYKEVLRIKDELEKSGFKVFVPYTADLMEKSGDYSRSSYKEWMRNPKMFPKKAKLMHWHFDEVKKADTILVINLKRKGVDGYIGGNVLMEMGLAFYLKKPIYILNQITKRHPFYEEILGVLPIFLNGDLKKIA